MKDSILLIINTGAALLTITTAFLTAFFIIIKPLRVRHEMKTNIINGTDLINKGLKDKGRDNLLKVINYPSVLFTGLYKRKSRSNRRSPRSWQLLHPLFGSRKIIFLSYRLGV